MSDRNEVMSKLQNLNVGDWSWISENADVDILAEMYDVLKHIQDIELLNIETPQGVENLRIVVTYFSNNFDIGE